MLANNETGTLQPIRAIAEVCRNRGVLLHCDATQAVGKVPVDMTALGVDLLSCSGHKMYGPKGVGALVMARRRPRLRPVPLLDGGGHEGGARSGTLNVPGIVGFAKALELCLADLAAEAARLGRLRELLRDTVVSGLEGISENGHPSERLPNTLNLSFAGVDGGALLASLREVALSSGSACTSAEARPSHVLAALGVPVELAHASLRFPRPGQHHRGGRAGRRGGRARGEATAGAIAALARPLKARAVAAPAPRPARGGGAGGRGRGEGRGQRGERSRSAALTTPRHLALTWART